MSQEIDYGVRVFDFATDSTQDFVNGVAGATNSNMHKITDAIKNKVTMDGVGGQNFNFTLSSKGDAINGMGVHTTTTQLPLLYKASKLSPTTWTQIQYSEIRDLANYIYKFM